MSPRYRSYDHRLKQAVVLSGNPNLFPKLRIPRSTALGWIRRGVPEVVTADELDLDAAALLIQNQGLKRELDQAVAVRDLAGFTFKLFGLQIQYRRLPRADDKSLLLAAIAKTVHITGLQAALHAIGLSAARFAAWTRRERGCDLQDSKSCPKSRPTKLTPEERQTIRSYAINKKLAHVSTTSLAWMAKRRGEVFASAGTWCKMVREEKLRVRMPRIYPAAAKVGIRAKLPGQIWHIDVSIVRLIDGTRAFIQAIVDNASRYIVAHHVAPNYGGLGTKRLIETALSTSRAAGHHLVPSVWCDSGVENLNANVDELIDGGAVSRTVAQVDVVQSNSMVETFFRRLKHAWLFVHPLPSVASVARLTAKYVRDHNELIPHYALAGATPAEAFAGSWSDDQKESLFHAGRTAIEERAKQNRASQCSRCSPPVELAQLSP